MSTRTPKDRDDLINLVIADGPLDWSTPDCAAAVAGLMAAALHGGFSFGVDWAPFWPTCPAEWEAVREQGIYATHIPRAPLERPTAAAELLAAVDESWRLELAGEPVPPNPWMVTSHGGNVLVPEPITRPLHPEEARLLGVWLIALADPTLHLAARELVRVATR